MKYVLAIIVLLCAVWLPSYISHILPEGWMYKNQQWWTGSMIFSLVILIIGLMSLFIYLFKPKDY